MNARNMRLVQLLRIVFFQDLFWVAEQALQFGEMRRGVETVLEEKGAPCKPPVHVSALLASVQGA